MKKGKVNASPKLESSYSSRIRLCPFDPDGMPLSGSANPRTSDSGKMKESNAHFEKCIRRPGTITDYRGKPMSHWIRKLSAFVLLVVAVAACGGGGGGGNSGNITPDGPGGASKLFVADSQNQKVISSTNVNPPTGVFSISRTISGSGVSNIMPDMAYDTANDRLYVVNNTSIAVFENASTASGNAPAKILTTTIGSTITSIFLDTVHDELYVANALSGIVVFNQISAASAGAIAPSRTISVNRGASTIAPDEIFVDTTHDVLYAKLFVGGIGGVARSIAIFSGASAIPSGPISVTQEITFTVAANILGMVGDGASDRLFVVDSTASTVMVFDGARAASGSAAPTRTINTPTFLQRIALVPNTNRLYGIAADTRTVYIINNASSANGSVPVTVLTNSSFGTLSALAVAQ